MKQQGLSGAPTRAEPALRPSPWARLQAWGAGRLAVIYGLWLAVAVIYWPSSKALDAIWTGADGEAYTHGYLVLLIALWLVFHDRHRLKETTVRAVPWAVLIVLALSVAWLFAWRAALQQVHIALLLPLLLASVVVALGWRIARKLLFPVGFLYFAMPLWAHINGLLQTLSAKANSVLIWWAGISAYMQGNFIQLPTGTIEIEGGCSGLHAFMVGLALAALYGELMEDRWPRRLLWAALMAALALLENWIRIFAVTVAANAFGMHTHLVKHHYWLGWYLFLAFFLGFLWLANRLRQRWDGSVGPGEPVRAPPTAAARARIGRVPVAVGLASLAILPALAYGMDIVGTHEHAGVAIDWPAPPAGWRGPQRVLASEWAPEYLDPSAKALRRYVDAQGQSVELYDVVYRTQTQHAKLLGYDNALLGHNALLQVQSQRIVDSRTGRWRETVTVDSAGRHSLIWSRYRIGDRRFVDARLSQLWYGLAALATRPVSSLTALRAVCKPNCRVARAQLEYAATRLLPVVRVDARHEGESRS